MLVIEDVADVLLEATRRGIKLKVKNGQLKYQPLGAMPPDFLDRLRACKADLIRSLDVDAAKVASSLRITPREKELMVGLSESARHVIGDIKRAFVPNHVTIVDVTTVPAKDGRGAEAAP